jgi:hypothetical protein
MPLRGGAGALLSGRTTRRLVSTLSPADGEGSSPGLAGWLEHVQAWRSAVLVVPERAIGVSVALRWGLTPEKFRLENEFRASTWGADPERPWHSRR